MKNLLYIPILMWGFFVLSFSVQASAGDIVISEVFYDAEGSDSGYEWVEIVNMSDGAISVKDWKFFESGVKHTLKVYAGSFDISPEEYVVIADNPDKFLARYPGYAGTLLDSSFSLKNSGELLEFLDSDLAVQASLDYTEFVTSGVAGYSLEQKENGAFERSCIQGGSPGVENCTDTSEETSCESVRITEVFPNPEGSESQEFIEVFNPLDKRVSLGGCRVQDASGNEDFLTGFLETQEYKSFLGTVSLNNSGDTILLLSREGEEIDIVSYEDAPEGWSFSLQDSIWEWTPYPTPDEENAFITYKEGGGVVVMSEILPNPEGDDSAGEFIELFNPNAEDVDLVWWRLQDAAGGEYVFDESFVVKPLSYAVIPREKFYFALNNSYESVTLLDPNGDSVSHMSYEKSSSGRSYVFDGSVWRMTKYLTPGSANKFNEKPMFKKHVIPDKAYKDVWVYFGTEGKDADDEEISVTWEFGDGRKSYKKETKHKYIETGKYTVTLTLSDGTEETVYTKTLKVKKYPKYKVKIRAVSPNPEGRDSDNEWILLKNRDDETISLEGWSVATGSNSKKLVNHPIYTDIMIEPGEYILLTRDDTKFTLPNTKATIGLRYPNGKEAYKIKYEKETIEEDEVFFRDEDAKQWRWGIIPRENINLKTGHHIVQITDEDLRRLVVSITFNKDLANIVSYKEASPEPIMLQSDSVQIAQKENGDVLSHIGYGKMYQTREPFFVEEKRSFPSLPKAFGRTGNSTFNQIILYLQR